MFGLCPKEKKSERVQSTNLQLNVQGNSNFTAPTIKPIKKLIKITKHSLEQKKSFSYELLTINSKNAFMKFVSKY
jgi:hypothetical protein